METLVNCISMAEASGLDPTPAKLAVQALRQKLRHQNDDDMNAAQAIAAEAEAAEAAERAAAEAAAECVWPTSLEPNSRATNHAAGASANCLRVHRLC
jgi:hypothetical protein